VRDPAVNAARRRFGASRTGHRPPPDRLRGRCGSEGL